VKRRKLKSNPTIIKGKTILKENDAQREEDSSQRFFGGEFSPNGDLFIY
jgi:hypothetical protein